MKTKIIYAFCVINFICNLTANAEAKLDDKTINACLNSIDELYRLNEMPRNYLRNGTLFALNEPYGAEKRKMLIYSPKAVNVVEESNSEHCVQKDTQYIDGLKRLISSAMYVPEMSGMGQGRTENLKNVMSACGAVDPAFSKVEQDKNSQGVVFNGQLFTGMWGKKLRPQGAPGAAKANP